MSRLTALLPSLWFGVLACAGAPPPAATATPPAAASTPSSAAPIQPAAAPTQPALGPEWAPLRPLVGAWSGTGGDATHPSRGGFTLAPDLGGHALVRRGSNDTATAHHEDLTIIYRAPDGALQASYFDN